MSKKWACRTYYNPNPFIGLSWHDSVITVPVPPFVVPAKLPHISFSVVQGLWIGAFLSNGRGKRVVGDDLFFMGRTSDAGLFVPHVSIPPSWMNIMTTLFGSSMILFGTSGVTVACKNVIWGNDDCDLAATPFGPVPFSLNLACWDPYSMPTDLVVVWGSVYTGMSLADLLAALIEFAINLACEVGMKYIGEPLMKKASAGMSAVGSKISAASKRAAAKKAAKTGIKKTTKSAFATAMSSVATSIRKLAGSEATDAMASYTKKAATTRGMYNSLKELCYSTGKNLDNELVDLVNAGTPGVFSKEFLSELQNINNSKYDDYVESMLKKQKGALAQAEGFASSDITEEFAELMKKSYMTQDLGIDTLMRTTFYDAMQQMSDAATKAASTELARSLGYVALKKSFSQMLWKYTIRNGGLINFDWGNGIAYDSSVDRQLSERWWANQDILGTELWSASDLGLTTAEDSEYWDESGVEDDGSDSDDYWYVSYDDSTSESSDSESSEEDEDDYWYGTDDNVDAAE